MGENLPQLPENFESLEEFLDFWDNHDAGNYWDLTKEVHFDINLEPRIDKDILNNQNDLKYEYSNLLFMR